MTETQRRIRAYKKALPHMKERVMAVALLFAMSLAMMTSASFAWLTLSRAPEVSGLATTVSTNGNLEIALSDIDGLAPDESAVGDGDGDITKTNLTWGNLINLSHESYGLSDIILRPATLNKQELATSPIYSVIYGSDGRVTGRIRNFGYTNYNIDNHDFEIKETLQYGVRGISSITYKNYSGNKRLDEQIELIYNHQSSAVTKYKQVYSNSSYMQTIGILVQIHANNILNGTQEDCAEYMPALSAMMEDFKGVVDEIGRAYVEIANLYYMRTLSDYTDYTPFTLAELEKKDSPIWGYLSDMQQFGVYNDQFIDTEPTKADELKDYDFVITFMELYGDVKDAYNGIAKAAAKAEQNQAVSWASDLRKYADILCDFETAEINGYTVDYLQNNLVSMSLTVMGWNKNTSVVAEIVGGSIRVVDDFLEGTFYVDNKGRDEDIKVNVDAKGIMTITLTPQVMTECRRFNSGRNFLYNEIGIAEEAAHSGGSNFKGDPYAAEIYAMAIDFWVRTNVPNALLKLEGEYITVEQPVMIKDAQGKEVEAFIYKHTTTNDQGQEETQEISVYKKNDVWYVAGDHIKLTDAVANPDPKLFEPVLEEKVVGYGGVNRVWSELDDPDSAASALLPEGSTSTTQGSGSCYVFYPQSIEDQQQGLKLLAAMRLAFVDAEGTLLAEGYMDTYNAIETAGRVVVPLRLFPNTAIEVDEDGNTESDYITPLNRNEPMRITTLVYLDGLNLSNEDVLAAGAITGQLNIQFGTNELELDPMDDKLMEDYYKIGFAQTEFSFGENDTDYTIQLKLELEGMTPNTVKGNFISVINATQGARQPQFTLEPSGGYYVANVTFSGPGNYQLRSLQIDGVDYALDEEDIVYVTVPGQKVTSLVFDNSASAVKKVLTADGYYAQPVSLVLNSANNSVASVRGAFQGENGSVVYVNFKSENGTNYSGTATFTTSDTYRLTFVYINNQVTPVNQELEIDVSLGLQAEVYLSSPYIYQDTTRALTKVQADKLPELVSDYAFTTGEGYYFIYSGAQELYFDITCYVKDDQDHPITGLENVEIFYGQGKAASAFDTGLTWDSDKNCYVGTFDFQNFGIFNFQKLTITDARTGEESVINRALSAHSITALSKDPASYAGNDLKELVVSIGSSDRQISLKMKNASAATMRLTATNPNYAKGAPQVLTATASDTVDGVSTFEFNLPGDGQWTITKAEASNVFYTATGKPEDGKFFKGEDDADWLNLMDLMPEGERLSTYFLTRINVEVGTVRPEKNYTGAFMAEHKVSGMTITVKDYNGENLATVFNRLGITQQIKIDMKYAGQEIGYQVSNRTNLPKHIFTGSSPANDPATFVMEDMNFVLAGEYTPNFSVTIGNNTYSADSGAITVDPILNANSNTIMVTWDKAKFEISAITPTAGTTVETYNGSSTGSGKTSISADKKTATVYAKHTSNSIACVTTHNYKQPSVTVKISNFGAATGAKLTFTTQTAGGTVLMYTQNQGTAATPNYEWSALSSSTEKQMWIGTSKEKDNATDDWKQAGTIYSTQYTLVHNGVEYTFTMTEAERITINNPL